MISWWHSDFGAAERDALLATFDRRQLTLGQQAAHFERELAEVFGVKDAVVTPSGTAALCMSLIAAGIEVGNEVIVPNFGWIATAQAAHILGAKVKLVDTQADSPSTSAEQLIDAISPNTKAIITMHFHGRDCGSLQLMDHAKDVGVTVIEDACKAMFCRYPEGSYVGTKGFTGCFSMGMVSLVSCGYGGFILTQDQAVGGRLRQIRDQGCQRSPHEAYLHKGFNFKVSDLLIALAREQLKRRDEKIQNVIRNYRLYAEGIAGLQHVSLIPMNIDGGEIPICVDLLCQRRDALIAYLSKQGIGTSLFHQAFNEAPFFVAANPLGSFPHSQRFARYGFMPPCGPHQSQDNIIKTLETIKDWELHADL